MNDEELDFADNPSPHDGRAFILDANGNQFRTGLLQPEGKPANFVSASPRLESALPLMTDADIQEILNDPNRTGAADEFDDHWVVQGDQKHASSCAGWGESNAFSKTRYRNGLRDGMVFSGSYPYSWCNRGQDNGAVLDDIMNESMNRGNVAASKCPWNMIYRKQTAQFDAEAALHEGLGLFSVKTQAEVNTALARRLIVVVCVQVDTTQYVNYKGNGLVPAFRGIGNHCIHVDDLRWNQTTGKYEYRQVGNWGLTWGLKGAGWCGWSSFAQTITGHSFYVLAQTQELAA